MKGMVVDAGRAGFRTNNVVRCARKDLLQVVWQMEEERICDDTGQECGNDGYECIISSSRGSALDLKRDKIAEEPDVEGISALTQQ